MTQILEARKGNITPEMEAVARAEGVSVEHVLTGIVNGTIVITRNNRHTSITPLGIGKGLRTKVNANIGTSKDRMSIDDEIAKLKVAVSAGADAVMARCRSTRPLSRPWPRESRSSRWTPRFYSA
jgi:phosphomethylpyrimidine synthase